MLLLEVEMSTLPAQPSTPSLRTPCLRLGFFTDVAMLPSEEWGVEETDASGGVLASPLPQFPLRRWKVGAEEKRGVKGGNGGGGPCARHPSPSVLSVAAVGGEQWMWALLLPLPRGKTGTLMPPRVHLGDLNIPDDFLLSFPHTVSRTERSHCPTQTVKKLLEEQRRRQQQPEAGGVPVSPG